MLIEFDVTQEDIDKAAPYQDIENCLGCTVLNRILKVDGIHMGANNFGIHGIVSHIRFGNKFKCYLLDTVTTKAKPEAHSIDIPESVLEQIGYFDQKSETFVEALVENTLVYEAHK